VILSGLLAAAVALVVGLFIMRLNGIAASIATFAFLAIVNVVYSNWRDVTGGTSSIVGIPVVVDVWTSILWVVITLVGGFLFQISRYGLSLRASRDVAFVAAGKHPGAGGLPVGISGRATVLLSGGIDSPVAAYRMMRRGLQVDFVHFHSHPLVSSASREKAYDLAAHLTRYEGRSRLALVPFADVQREIVARTLRPLRVVLYRRFMLRIASAIARRSGSAALITGESLGQVASQTLTNMTVIEQAATLPMLRPLVGMDKNEIVIEARGLGTFETSKPSREKVRV